MQQHKALNMHRKLVIGHRGAIQLIAVKNKAVNHT